MVTREWVAVHRKHHAFCETENDPHSPVIFGLRTIALRGAEVYQVEAAKAGNAGKIRPRHARMTGSSDTLYRYGLVGVYTTLVIDIALFGAGGITMFAFQMMAMPFFAAGVINGFGHAIGYRNFESEDASTNLVPIAVLVGGEELHNNHHAFPTSARFSARSGEFDIGWFYIRVLSALGLCRVSRVAPVPHFADEPRAVDVDTLRAVLQNRMHVLRDYSRRVMMPVLRMERRARRGDVLLRSATRLLTRWPGLLDDAVAPAPGADPGEQPGAADGARVPPPADERLAAGQRVQRPARHGPEGVVRARGSERHRGAGGILGPACGATFRNPCRSE